MSPLQNRHARQILIEEIGEDGQRRLQQARVLVAGAGHLFSLTDLSQHTVPVLRDPHCPVCGKL